MPDPLGILAYGRLPVIVDVLSATVKPAPVAPLTRVPVLVMRSCVADDSPDVMLSEPVTVPTDPLSEKIESPRVSDVAHFGSFPAVPVAASPPPVTTVTLPDTDADDVPPDHSDRSSRQEPVYRSPSMAVTIRSTRLPSAFSICTSVTSHVPEISSGLRP